MAWSAAQNRSEGQVRRHRDLRVQPRGNGKSQILATAGFIKLVRQKDGPVVGVHMVGSRVGELIGEGQLIYNWGGVPGGRAAPRPRPPDPERSNGRGASGAAGKPSTRTPDSKETTMATSVTMSPTR